MDNREEWLAHTFIELADSLVADFDVIDLMCVLVDRCAELLQSTEVALALADPHGQLRALASTTERMRVLELIEIQSDEDLAATRSEAGSLSSTSALIKPTPGGRDSPPR